MIKHSKLLSTTQDLQELKAKLEQTDCVAFDTEFIRESTFFPSVEIIQVATRDESWIVDAKAFLPPRGKPENLSPLIEVFRNPKILKILHAAQGDQECMFTSFGHTATPVIDTAIAASLCGYGEGIGLGNLLRAVLGINIKKGHARTDWSVRPLPEQLIEYAHADVEHLVLLADKLMVELDRLGRRAWALEQTAKFEDPALYEPSAEDIAGRLSKSGKLDKKGYAALIELIRWREERVRKLNLPRRWVADDAVLVDLAQVRPKDLAHLGAFRGINKGELKHSGEAILEALRVAETVTDIQLPRPSRPDVPSDSESQMMDLLKCYVGILSDEHKIASKNLLTASQYLPLIRADAATPQDWVRRGLINEGAARLIGDELLALLKGQRALSISEGRIKVIKIDSSGA